MKTLSSLLASLLLIPTFSAAQPWSAELTDAVLRPGDPLHFQKVNLREDDRDMIRLVAKTAPAVVMIIAKGKPEPVEEEDNGLESQGLEDFLNQLLKKRPEQQGAPEAEQQPPAAQPQADGNQAETAPKAPKKPRTRTPTSDGSGVIISYGGHKLIVTNNHVVEIVGSHGRVDLVFHDGSKGTGTVLGRNEKYDLAFIEPDNLCSTCRTMPIGDSSKVKRGQISIAIGSPFALNQTVTVGHISFLGRDIDAGGVVQDFIQTDASINPGNSGGALVDRNGRLIGINTAIFSKTGTSAGIGFATPSNYIPHVLNRFLRTKVISPSRMGLVVGRKVQTDENGEPKRVNDEPVLGPLIVAEAPKDGTPAAVAGFQKGDQVLSVDGRSVTNPSDFVRIITDKVPGEKAVVVVRRGDQTLTIASDVVSMHD